MRSKTRRMPSDRQTQSFVLSICFVVFSVGFIFSNSLQSGVESAAVSGVVMRWVHSILDPAGKIPEDIFHFWVRKTAHFLEFFLLGSALRLLMASIWGKFKISCPGTMLFSCLTVAVCDEFIQSFTGRTSSVRDVLIDFSGGLCGFLLVGFLLWLLHKRRRP